MSNDNTKTYPKYTENDVKEHNTVEKRIWVTFKDGVYDVTDYIKAHPGGQTTLKRAAGGNLEKFWKVYQFHHVDKIY